MQGKQTYAFPNRQVGSDDFFRIDQEYITNI